MRRASKYERSPDTEFSGYQREVKGDKYTKHVEIDMSPSNRGGSNLTSEQEQLKEDDFVFKPKAKTPKDPICNNLLKAS